MEFKKSFFKEFDRVIMGWFYFLGIEVKQQYDGTFISQKKYTMNILEKKIKMYGCNLVNILVAMGKNYQKRRWVSYW